MLKTQEVLFECKRSTFITAAMLIILARCSASTITRASEGNIVQLNFSYPCVSTKVTLQHGYKSPFFSSANPEAILLSWNHVLENTNDTVNDNCSLHLTIDPVSRDDAGTYILTAYKNGQLLPEYPRIGLRVSYPPGKASCETSNEYADEWVSVQCTASAGNLAGQIVCYQNGMRLPELTKPEETGGTLRQTILARFIADPVRRCSYSMEQTLDMCGCKDCGWDPIGKSAIDNITDPCPASLPTPHVTHSQTPDKEMTESVNSSLITDLYHLLKKAVSKTTPTCTPKSKHPNLHVDAPEMITCIFTCMGITMILALLYIWNIRQTKQLSTLKIRKCNCDNHLKLLQSTQDHQV